MKLQTLKKPAAWSTLLAYMLVFASPFAEAAPGALSNAPLFLTTTVQPNVMIFIDNSGSMGAGVPGSGGRTRMQVARDVATNLVTNTPGMRFGIASFNPNNTTQGGIIRAACGSPLNTLTAAINNLNADTWTPLAEAYYEITRYFRGMNSQYNGGITPINTAYVSPIQFRCQKNFTIIITDGEPTLDDTFLNNDPDDILNTTRALPNWDNNPNDFPGGQPRFLDDLALFGQDIDMRRAPATDTTGASFDDPNFPIQNLNTFTIGFTVESQMLEAAANNGRGQYFTAANAAELENSLERVVSNIASRVGSASAVAFNTSTLGTNSAVYQAKFNSGLWSGELLSYALDPNNGNLAASASWNAATVLDARVLSSNDRKILTYNPTSKRGIPFQWNTTTLSATQQNDLNMGPNGTADGFGNQRLSFLRGDRSREGANTAPSFRLRGSRLGDIVHSNPVYVGLPSLNYPDTAPFPTATGSKYSDFKASQTSSPRQGVVYVGANDGMLHGFNASTGAEVMAYIPHNLFSSSPAQGLHYLTDNAYGHLYYVDQGPTVSDAYIKTTPSGSVGWKTVLVGGEEAGGRGLFALDITDPSTFSEDSTATDNTVMWEFTSTNDPDLGYTFSKPVIALMNNGRWAAIFGNGYNDTGAGQAQLFIVYLDGGLDGTWTISTSGTPNADYYKITTDVGAASPNQNGLSSPAAVDLDGNGTVDRVYAGDLQGNMWAFDLSNTVKDTNWKVADSQGQTPKPLFTAKNAAGDVQPITTKPSVAKNPTIPNSNNPSNAPNLLVLFGTGQYLVDGDKTTTSTQSFYGVWDKGDKELNRSHLVEQTFLTGFASDARVLSDNTVDYTTKYGWYIDLNSSNAATGERVVVNPKVRGNYVFFNSMTPNNAACSLGGSSWLMAAKFTNGGRPSDSVFDYDKNNSVDNSDKLSAAVTTTVVTTATTITTTTTIGGVTTTTVTSNTTGAAPGTVTTNTTTNIAISGRRMQQDAIAAESAFLGDHQYTANSGDQNGASVDEGRVNTGTSPTRGRLSWKEIRR